MFRHYELLAVSVDCYILPLLSVGVGQVDIVALLNEGGAFVLLYSGAVQ